MSWTPDPEGPQPGTASDRRVAKAHRVCLHTVFRYRKAHDIPASGEGRTGRPPGGWEPARAPWPGDATDTAVGSAHGVSADTVRRWRKRNGVGRYSPCSTGGEPGK